MTRILITAIGGDIGQAAATVVRQVYPSWKILGCDAGDRHAGALYADAVYRAPRADSTEYVEWLCRMVEREGVELCLPMSEPELKAIAGDGRNSTLPLLWAGKRAVEVGTDKLLTSRFLQEIGIPSPWTLDVSDAEAVPSYPCILKLRRGSGSKVVLLCNNPEEVGFYSKRHPDTVLQEYLAGDDREVTCAVFRRSDGETTTLQLLRRLTGGMTGWAKVIEDAEISKQCQRVAEQLDVVGAINIQLRMGPSGPRIFEINPRLSSTLLMRHVAGFSDAVWMIEDALGRLVSLAVPEIGTVLVRTYGGAVIAPEEMDT